MQDQLTAWEHMALHAARMCVATKGKANIHNERELHWLCLSQFQRYQEYIKFCKNTMTMRVLHLAKATGLSQEIAAGYLHRMKWNYEAARTLALAENPGAIETITNRLFIPGNRRN